VPAGGVVPAAAPLVTPAAPAAAPAVPEDLSVEARVTAKQEALPTIRQLITRKAAPSIPCLSPQDFKRINTITNDIAAEKGDFPTECSLGNPDFQPRRWPCKTYTWTATGLCHKPLYFEDEQLERYGHTCGPLWQSLISPAKFFLTFPVLPYKMGLTPPNENIYVLGYYRPGDRSPYMLDAIPLSVRAGVFEAIGWGAGFTAL
jgi:hypothetical protein